MIAVSCLHPLLRLLRGLEMGDLSEIDALLGSYIVMPVPAVYSDFSQLSPYQQLVALHCLFHCINWLHEVINCFAYLVKNGEPDKVCNYALISETFVIFMKIYYLFILVIGFHSYSPFKEVRYRTHKRTIYNIQNLYSCNYPPPATLQS